MANQNHGGCIASITKQKRIVLDQDTFPRDDHNGFVDFDAYWYTISNVSNSYLLFTLSCSLFLVVIEALKDIGHNGLCMFVKHKPATAIVVAAEVLEGKLVECLQLELGA